MAEMKIKDGKINFRCKAENCKHSCCGPFAGVSSEICSLDKRPFDEIVLTDEDYNTLCERGYEGLTEEAYSEITCKKYHKMALEQDGTCKAWKDGRCSIHDVSPTLCKAFPFYFDMFAGLCAIECDGFSDESWTELDEYSDYIEYARKMYSFWLDFYSKK